MRKLLILFLILVFNFSTANSEVVNLELDEIINIGLEQNQYIKIKRIELEAAKKDIKIDERKHLRQNTKL